MPHQEAEVSLYNIFIRHFQIPPGQFAWDLPLEVLQKDFKLLSYLVYLEQLVQQEFGKDVQIVEHISPAFHTSNSRFGI